MAGITKLSDKLIILLNDIEDAEFEPFSQSMFYGGVKYTREDFKNMRGAIEQVKTFYQNGVNKSTRYIQKNREYHNTIRKLSYYSNKKHKSDHDYVMIEKFTKQLDEIKEKRDNEKEDNN